MPDEEHADGAGDSPGRGPHGVVAVTGGAGFVGRHLVRRLRSLGAVVRVVDLAAGAVTGVPGVEPVRADLRDFGATRAALRGAEVVFHLAGNASGTLSVENPRLDFELNALATSNVGNAALEVGVRRLVYLSSAVVYGRPCEFPISERHPTRPFLPYGASKLSGELVLRCLHDARGLPVVIGRSFVIYGPGEDPRRAGGEVSQFLRWHLNGRPIPVVGDVDRKTRDFIHVHDLVSALLRIADRGEDGGVYNLGTGTETSMRRLAEEIGAVTGTPARLDADAGVVDDSFRLMADIGRLSGLGFRPRITLADGVRSLGAALGSEPELPSVNAVFRVRPAGVPDAGGREMERAGT
ncbi:NAD-dependent epimerase/dehydratase family protein [Saccharothrix australiensis]|uniref:UDP-glucose 4-epimerase n=1 Tax=Saccharothrix australiensis TaxID=2072 RepID=A0A495VWT3_9PSEU|nr:NAD-dependent epimerase/dehydratase family protein [Saccharothrix australiensis]RKT53689.1 UDP-glucose 4-epimerase [Saccharothrix australiensis]